VKLSEPLKLAASAAAAAHSIVPQVHFPLVLFLEGNVPTNERRLLLGLGVSNVVAPVLIDADGHKVVFHFSPFHENCPRLEIRGKNTTSGVTACGGMHRSEMTG
jgi:hypothetical protein